MWSDGVWDSYGRSGYLQVLSPSHWLASVVKAASLEVHHYHDPEFPGVVGVVTVVEVDEAFRPMSKAAIAVTREDASQIIGWLLDLDPDYFRP